MNILHQFAQKTGVVVATMALLSLFAYAADNGEHLELPRKDIIEMIKGGIMSDPADPATFDVKAAVSASVEKWASVYLSETYNLPRTLMNYMLPPPIQVPGDRNAIDVMSKRQVLIFGWNVEFVRECPPLSAAEEIEISNQIKFARAEISKTLNEVYGSRLPQVTPNLVEVQVERRFSMPLHIRLANPISYQCKSAIAPDMLDSDLREFRGKIERSVDSAAKAIVSARDKEQAAKMIVSDAVRIVCDRFAQASSDPIRKQAAEHLLAKARNEHGDLLKKVQDLNRSRRAAMLPATQSASGEEGHE